MAEERVHRRLAAILVADVVGYSRLIERDEEGTRARLRSLHAEVIDPRIAADGGRMVKTTGDGILVEFGSVVDAVRNALAIQTAMSGRNDALPEDRRIVFRIGINVGDVIVEGADIHGDGVNIAARLEGLCGPGEVYVSGTVYDQAAGKLAATFEDLGEQTVKNIARPVRVYRTRARSEETADAVATAGPLPLPDKPSIAVLAFENMSGDPEQEYFADGITEDIITELSKISGLFVIARHSAFTYKGKSVTLKQVGRELGVRCVLEGSVRKAGNRLRITAQLIDAMTDHHLWAERYDRDFDDIFEVQDEVARSVASALAVALKPDERERLNRPPTENIEAYDLYLRTRATPWPPTRENLLTARSAYQRITEIEPSFAGGHAGQSMTHSFAVIFGLSEQPDDDARVGLELANSAVALGDRFAQAYSALGLAHTAMGQHDEAVAYARQAVEMQPGDADAQTFMAMSLLFAGQADDAHDAITTALRLDPQYVHGPYLNLLGVVCFSAGRYEDAIDAFKRNVERGGPLAATALTFRTAAFSAAGYVEEAKVSASELLKFFPDFSVARYRMLYMFKKPDDTEQVVGALRKAGLPE